MVGALFGAFLGHASLTKIILFVVILLTSFMLLIGSMFLCMVQIKIAFLVWISLVLLYFSFLYTNGAS